MIENIENIENIKPESTTESTTESTEKSTEILITESAAEVVENIQNTQIEQAERIEPLNQDLNQPLNPQNLILIGMMGSGKTTIGKALSKYLARPFFDLDHEIEAHCGTDIPTIFALEGEAGFRRRETDMLNKLMTQHQQGIILATGGGAILQAKNQEIIQSKGLVIYLEADVEELWQRTRYDKRRPLLANSNPLATLEKIYFERSSIYQKLANHIVQTSHNQLLRVLNDITKILYQGS